MHCETFWKFIRHKVRFYRLNRTEYVPVSSPTQTMADFYPLTRNYALFTLRQKFVLYHAFTYNSVEQRTKIGSCTCNMYASPLLGL